MPIEWYLMKQPIYNSGFEGDEFANYAQDGFEEILESELADDIEIFEKSLSVEPVKTRAIIQGVTSDTYNNSGKLELENDIRLLDEYKTKIQGLGTSTSDLTQRQIVWNDTIGRGSNSLKTAVHVTDAILECWKR